MNAASFLSRSWRTFRVALAIILGLAFVYAGAVKLQDPLKFADAIHAFQLTSKSTIMPLALGLPVLEILAGLLLITGWQRRLGACAVICLTLLFATVLVSALMRGLVINCSCFGDVGAPTRLRLWSALGRDLVLGAGALWIYGAVECKIVRVERE